MLDPRYKNAPFEALAFQDIFDHSWIEQCKQNLLSELEMEYTIPSPAPLSPIQRNRADLRNVFNLADLNLLGPITSSQATHSA